MNSSYYGKTAMLSNTRSGVEVEAEIDNVRETKKGEPESLEAFIATNKIKMKWNGKVYVGNAHGMEFTTLGPQQYNTNKGRR